jgi:hypothetical protein
LRASSSWCKDVRSRPSGGASSLFEIPEGLLQLAYLARTLVDGLSAPERQDYFARLVTIARADGVQVFEERHTLSIIAKYLYVTPERRSQP